MFFPLIPVASSILAALGIYLLFWYTMLSKEDKEKADGLASQYAMSLYRKGLADLTQQQVKHVYSLVKSRHFDGGR